MVMALSVRIVFVIFMVFSFLVADERASARGGSLAGLCAKGRWPFSVLVWANASRRAEFPVSHRPEFSGCFVDRTQNLSE